MAVALVLLMITGVGVVGLFLTFAEGGLFFDFFVGILVLLTALLGTRMAIAGILGRRMYWWPGQREYDHPHP